MTRPMSLRGIGITHLALALAGLSPGCATPNTTDRFGFIQVTETGANRDEAVQAAKRSIVRAGVDEYISTHSVLMNSQIRDQITRAHSEGFLHSFSVLSERRRGSVFEITARGKVNGKAVQDALRLRYADLGKPRLMFVFAETILGRTSPSGATVTENKLVAVFNDFEFVDTIQAARIRAQEGGHIVDAYADADAQQRAVSFAADLDAEVLVVGRTEVARGPSVEGTGMYTYHASVSFRLISVGSARILAADTVTAGKPAVSASLGVEGAISNAVLRMRPRVIEQIEKKWKPGGTIRIAWENITVDEFTDRRIASVVRTIPGVTAVHERGQAGEALIIEVEALMNASRLYAALRAARSGLGIDFTAREIKAGRIRLAVKKP